MGLCSFSTTLRNSSSTIIDNEFINEFLPGAPDGAVKVYLYGLYLCSNPQSDDNDISAMSTVLSLSADQIFEYFSYLTFINILAPKVMKSAKYVRPYIIK